jgi:SAM-dependent methyltransferase
MNNSIYIHTEDVHNLNSPSRIVPVVCDFLNPSSVADLGCGIGTFLHCFKQNGVKRVLGIDGEWANKELIAKYLKKDEFFEANIEEEIKIDQRFDLAICLEVAEHIDSKFADNLVTTLTNISDVIIFAAALPNQGGQNHINEQYPHYWELKFKEQGYIFIDCFRDVFWDNKEIFWWYKQNMFLVVKDGHKIDLSKLQNLSNGAKSRIHPELFEAISQISDITQDRLIKIEQGELSVRKYLRLLSRALKRKFRFKNDFTETIIFDKNNPIQRI